MSLPVQREMKLPTVQPTIVSATQHEILLVRPNDKKHNHSQIYFENSNLGCDSECNAKLLKITNPVLSMYSV